MQTNMVPRFVVIDLDTGEAFSTTIFGSLTRARVERDRLALKYGEHALGIGYKHDDGSIEDLS